jgi:hypothetical protein
MTGLSHQGILSLLHRTPPNFWVLSIYRRFRRGGQHLLEARVSAYRIEAIIEVK